MDKVTNKLFSKKGFPSHLVSDEEKSEYEFGLQYAKAIEREWFYKTADSLCGYYDKRDKIHKLRLYGRGEQPTDIYKNLINDGDQDSYTNYDWRPLQIVPKFVKLIVNQMTERLFDIKAEAVDKFSTDLRDGHKKYLEDLVTAKPIMAEAKKVLGVDLFPDNFEELPDNEEEINLHMKLKYKPAIEIAAEEALKFTLEMNDYDEIQSRVVEDETVIGIGGVKHCTDLTKGILVEYVDPANLIYSYPNHRNFKDVHYYGEVETITINELKRISEEEIDNEELVKLAEMSHTWASYQGNYNDRKHSEADLESNLGAATVDIMHFNFKSTNTITYKKKHLSNGGFKLIKKESTFKKKDKNYKGFDVLKRTIDVWYEGILILGTNKIINYKLCENMIRPEGHLHHSMPNYILYAPELYQNRTKSLVERIIPYVDQMQQIHIKLQQLIAKARPNGIYIDVAGLSEIDMGEGNGSLTPLEVIKIYDDTGNVIGTSITDEGEYNHGRVPIQELKNGIIDGLDRLIAAYNHYLNLLRDSIGIPQGADASMPHHDTLVGVQQQVALNSNTATRHILDSSLNISERLGKSLSLRLKDIFKYSNLKDVYINAIGKINVDYLEALKKYHLHDLGINIILKPDSQEKQQLEANIQQALQQQTITLDDAIDIRSIGNVKLANQLLKTRRIRREKTKREHERQLEEIRQEGSIRAAQEAAQSEQMKIQAKLQADLQLAQAEIQGKIMLLQAEKEAKSELMEREFGYNMTLRGIDVETTIMNEKYKEDRKDKRQAKQSTQASKMIEQRNNKQPAINFESSEDNITGSMDLGEMEPS